MKFLEIRCSEIASEAILGQKQSHSYMVRGVIHPKFWLSMYAFAKPVDFEFPLEKVLSFAGQQVTPLEGLLLRA